MVDGRLRAGHGGDGVYEEEVKTTYREILALSESKGISQGGRYKSRGTNYDKAY